MSLKCYSVAFKLRALAVTEVQNSCFLAKRVAECQSRIKSRTKSANKK